QRGIARRQTASKDVRLALRAIWIKTEFLRRGRTFAGLIRNSLVGRSVQSILSALLQQIVAISITLSTDSFLLLEAQRRVFRLRDHLLEQQLRWRISPLRIGAVIQKPLGVHPIGGLCPALRKL